jgi:hypothetical protein
MKKIILKYFLIGLIVLPINSIAQDSTWVRGIRLGCDLSRFAVPYTQTGSEAAMEFSIDTEWKPKYFATGELGFGKIHLSNDFINYKSNTIYGRIGYDKNILKHDSPNYKDMFFYGYRYGMAMVRQEITSFTIADSLWGPVNGSYPPKTVFHHWAELVGGIRLSITNSIFLGFSGRLRIKLFSQKDVVYPFNIPGFGNGAKKVTMGFNYSLYIQIPVKKVKLTKAESAKLKE